MTGCLGAGKDYDSCGKDYITSGNLFIWSSGLGLMYQLDYFVQGYKKLDSEKHVLFL